MSYKFLDNFFLLDFLLRNILNVSKGFATWHPIKLAKISSFYVKMELGHTKCLMNKVWSQSLSQLNIMNLKNMMRVKTRDLIRNIYILIFNFYIINYVNNHLTFKLNI